MNQNDCSARLIQLGWVEVDKPFQGPWRHLRKGRLLAIVGGETHIMLLHDGTPLHLPMPVATVGLRAALDTAITQLELMQRQAGEALDQLREDAARLP